MNNITFAAINLDISNIEKNKMVEEIKQVPLNFRQWNEFRGCDMIAIYNGSGYIGPRNKDINTSKGKFKYTDAISFCPTIKKVCEEKIFPFMDPIGRVTVLHTKSETGLNIHLDTTEEEIGTLQHKYRLVLSGNISKLFFLDQNENKIFVPSCYDSYIIDGSHPHSIDPDNSEKITLCIGAPWKGKPTSEYQRLLDESPFSMSISRPKTKKEWLDPFFLRKKND